MINQDLPPPPALSLEDLMSLAESSASVLESVRAAMLEPYPRKTPPDFSVTQTASLCGMDKVEFKNAEVSIKSARGRVKEGSNQKFYQLSEAQELIRLIGKPIVRPEGKKGKIIAVCSYKGGVTKTTSSVQLAQGLTLRGLKVLLVDIDGQGSATTLMGFSPELEISYKQTLVPFIKRYEDDLGYAVQSTYWPNLDLIPASSSLLQAEYLMPAKASKKEFQDAGYRFWDELAEGLDPLREQYDAIVLDTSPSLGYLTQAAMAGADIVLTPCPTEGLDFASLCQFWGVFVEMVYSFRTHSEKMGGSFNKTYDFVEVFLTKTKPESDTLAAVIKSWINKAFPGRVYERGVPESSIPKAASAEMRTVYDLCGKETASGAYKRYKEPVDAWVDHIASELAQAWRR